MLFSMERDTFKVNNLTVVEDSSILLNHILILGFQLTSISLCKLGFRHVGAQARCEIVSNCNEVCALTIKVFE